MPDRMQITPAPVDRKRIRTVSTGVRPMMFAAFLVAKPGPASVCR
jgi:hypothetical protein